VTARSRTNSDLVPGSRRKDSTQRPQSKTIEITEEKTHYKLFDLCKNSVISVLRPFSSVAALLPCAALALIVPIVCLAQQQPELTLKEQIVRKGVFFRADAPYVLRNHDDTFLPITLEIINGIEKVGHSTAAMVAKYLTRDPIRLEGVNLYVKPVGSQHHFAPQPVLLSRSSDFSFDARSGGQPIDIPERMKKTLEVPLAAIRSYLEQHYVGGPYDNTDLKVSFHAVGWASQDFYLRARLSAPPLPELPGWYRGDMHYHSGYTNNPAERGHPLNVTRQVALAAGLNWIALTDHSTDLSEEDYAQELREVQSYRDGRFLFIRGEEVTVSSNKPSGAATVHMVALPSPEDPDRGFPDSAGSSTVILTGDGSPGSTPAPLKEALGRIASSGGFVYAAHPFDPISPLLKGGAWDLPLDFLGVAGKQLQAPLVGLEPWNRATAMTADDARDPYCLHLDADPTACFQPDKDANQYARLEKGIEIGWRPLLLAGLKTDGDAPPRKVFLAAGSDAHGDFNFEATMDALDLISKPSRGLSGYAEDNALGKISTVVYCPFGMGRRGENVLAALRDGHIVLSNGPLLVAGFHLRSGGSSDEATGPGVIGIGQHVSFPPGKVPSLEMEWASSNEFGSFRSIRLIIGSSSGEGESIELPIPSQKALASDGLYPVDLGQRLARLNSGWGYIRLEARTRNNTNEEFRCYTNPIWVRVTE